MKLSEALVKYIAFGQYKNKASSMATYHTHIRHLCVHFKNCDIEDVKLTGIIEYLDLMREVGWDRNAFVAKCCAWKQFFKFFRQQDFKVLDPDLIPIPEVEPRFPKIIEEPDYRKLLTAVNEYVGFARIRGLLILHLLWDTGMRLNELRSLDVGDMNLEKMCAIIKTEKSRGIRPTRTIFWTSETNRVLKEYLNARASQKISTEEFGNPLLITTHGRWATGKRWSETAIEGMMKKLSLNADLGYTANPHRFRHRFGRNLALKGANNSIISDMMGHSSMESSRIYTVMNQEMMQDTYNKFFKD